MNTYFCPMQADLTMTELLKNLGEPRIGEILGTLLDEVQH